MAKDGDDNATFSVQENPTTATDRLRYHHSRLTETWY